MELRFLPDSYKSKIKKVMMPIAEDGDAAAAAALSLQAPVQNEQAEAAADGSDDLLLLLQQSAPKLAPFTPSGDGVLAFAMELLQLGAQDVLFDLGCGDARILVHAAQTSGTRWEGGGHFAIASSCIAAVW